MGVKPFRMFSTSQKASLQTCQSTVARIPPVAPSCDAPNEEHTGCHKCSGTVPKFYRPITGKLRQIFHTAKYSPAIISTL